jgi:hypothetical protein
MIERATRREAGQMKRELVSWTSQFIFNFEVGRVRFDGAAGKCTRLAQSTRQN